MQKTYSEVRCLVKNEVDQIRKRDGNLKTAYVVIEVASRLKTLTPWEGYNPTKPLAQNLRPIVEEVVKGGPSKIQVMDNGDSDISNIPLNEYEVLDEDFRDKKRASRSVDRLPALVGKQRLKNKLKHVS